MKNCSKCLLKKPLTDFAKQGKESHCKLCKKINRNKKSKKRADLKYYFDGLITLEDYDRMFAEQKGACAICHTHRSALTQDLAVDHCHTTNAVRGLLCGPCNRGIGLLKDSSKIAKAAAAYLEVR